MRAGFDVLSDFAMKVVTFSSFDYHSADFTMTLKQTHNGDLASGLIPSSARSRKLRNAPCQNGLVHIARLAADVSLIDFHVSLELHDAAVLQRKADATRQEAAILTAKLDAQEQVESELWAQLWALPQAVEWERAGWTREVAQYVRWKARAEQGDLDAAKEARQLGDRLGLTPLALLRLRWRVSGDEDDRAVRPRRRVTASGRRSDDPRAALHVVE